MGKKLVDIITISVINQTYINYISNIYQRYISALKIWLSMPVIKCFAFMTVVAHHEKVNMMGGDRHLYACPCFFHVSWRLSSVTVCTSLYVRHYVFVIICMTFFCVSSFVRHAMYKFHHNLYFRITRN